MTEEQEKLDKVFGALADHTRRSILMELKEQPMTVMQLANSYEMSFQAVSKHLKVLEKANLLSKEKKGRQFICRSNHETLTNAINWISQQHEFWKHNFNSLDNFLKKQDE